MLPELQSISINVLYVASLIVMADFYEFLEKLPSEKGH